MKNTTMFNKEEYKELLERREALKECLINTLIYTELTKNERGERNEEQIEKLALVKVEFIKANNEIVDYIRECKRIGNVKDIK